ncbi:1-deoxy-D-xylulose-5-phosphate synthase, partial [candidate division WOR-3 bacterium]|nr:1-deoxy-D-xylulose-5-phosphate synthase [candidate division WOR-3 bacterium]
APKDGTELIALLKTAIHYRKGPFVIRYPRSSCAVGESNPGSVPIGSWEMLNDGKNAAIIATGSMVTQAQEALPILRKKGVKPILVNARFVKPLDAVMLDKIAKQVRTIITVEENACHGGLGSAVFDFCREKDTRAKIHCIGLPDSFVEHGARKVLLKISHLDAEGIAKRVYSFL